MPGLYRGEIDRLLIFAAPSGSGKTAFLNAPEKLLAEEAVPEVLVGFHEMARNHRTILSLKDASIPSFVNLCIHVDLTNPIRWMKRKPRRRDDLLERLTPKIYSDWTELKTYATRAATLDIVTFFVRREEHFRRWAGRGLSENPNGYLRRIVTMVNGDSTHDSELHRRVYWAWCAFARSLNPRSFHVVDGNGDNYEFISPSEFEAEISQGYKG